MDFNLETTERLNVAVLCGGTSDERSVSFASAAQIVPALRRLGHSVRVIDTSAGLLSAQQERELITVGAPKESDNSGRVALVGKVSDPTAVVRESVKQFDLVFIALHGGTGEDGTVQALLDVMGIPYTGSGHTASAMCMDKDISKRLFRAAGIMTPNWELVTITSATPAVVRSFPVVVKPNKQGSTVGVSIARNDVELKQAVEFAFRFDDEVLIEDFIAGRELTVGVLNDQALTVGEAFIGREEIFDFRAKYSPGAVTERFPADLSANVSECAKRDALKAHKVLKLNGYSRADFRLDDDGTLWCLEVNSLPGLTATSLLPQSAAASDIPFDVLCQTICRLAYNRRV